MVIRTKNEETLLLFVPKGSHSPKNGRAVEKCVCCDADSGFGQGDYLSLKERVLREIHKSPPAMMKN
jgi:hypothetical protein